MSTFDDFTPIPPPGVMRREDIDPDVVFIPKWVAHGSTVGPGELTPKMGWLAVRITGPTFTEFEACPDEPARENCTGEVTLLMSVEMAGELAAGILSCATQFGNKAISAALDTFKQRAADIVRTYADDNTSLN